MQFSPLQCPEQLPCYCLSPGAYLSRPRQSCEHLAASLTEHHVPGLLGPVPRGHTSLPQWLKDSPQDGLHLSRHTISPATCQKSNTSTPPSCSEAKVILILSDLEMVTCY